ncbi:TlpA family protein disulfide reductase [Alicyclobacillus fodiniaquatilis]|uniref:TlpA family protein disulfide reductase n=1 Tax=Alicyclobacillus fodiniaquatilis TaxID=1661150 RepID=A0ABW4JFR5_9BACL
MKIKSIFPLASILLIALTGCGIETHSTKTASTKATFQNLISDDVIKPDTKLDPHKPFGVDYTHVEVVDAKGHHVTLNASKTPILFTAYWCPHCQRTLRLLSSQQNTLQRMPVVVSFGFAKNTTLKTAVGIQHAEISQLKLHGFKVYYDLSPSAGDEYAPLGYPTLAYDSGGSIVTLYGEHTLDIWKQVL